MTKTHPISPLLAALVGMGVALFLGLFVAMPSAKADQRSITHASKHRCKSWGQVVTQIASLTIYPGQMARYRKAVVDPLATEVPLIHHYLIAVIERSYAEPYAIADAVLDGSWLKDCALSISGEQLALVD
ncbi:MAG: hypothetical protein HQ481_10350 [Alphaproteobacteria bacterium]|nr:hypothetical protein [Alphaproteobacteria bacterium]